LISSNDELELHLQNCRSKHKASFRMQRQNRGELIDSSNRQTATSTTALIKLDSFQSTDFVVANLVGGLMEDDVKRARTEGGSE
jgi:hypothetical protein